MRKYNFLVVLLLTQLVYSQSEVDSSQEEDESVNTSQNITKINLFTLDFDGKKIPINLVYSHKGIKIGELNRDGGVGWRIEDLGYINRVVNGLPDNLASGWFNSNTLDFTSQSWIGQIENGGQIPAHNGGDLSPDFFTCSLINEGSFDFVYKKHSNGSLTPVLLSNSEGYKIDTNFSNFISNPNLSNNNPVFNIYDKRGNQYNFINGPNLKDYHYDSNYDTHCRNNYYLQSMANTTNTANLNIEYYSRIYPLREQHYRMAQTSNGPGNYDYDNYIVAWDKMENGFYDVDDSHLVIKKITSDNAVVDFIYNEDNYLTEINMTDVNGSYIQGYSFEYLNEGAAGLIGKIKKYNNSKTNLDLIYEFEYFIDFPDFSFYMDNQKRYEDHFGYYNGIYKQNSFPFAIRESNNTITPAGDYTPNITYAKQLSLKKIINKYGGITEFDYQLNSEYQEYGNAYGTINGEVYAGGILLSSKKATPNVGKSKFTVYNYSKLRGFVILGNASKNQYITAGLSGRLYKGIPELYQIDFQVDSYYENINDDVFWNNIHEKGNFYRITAETNFDFENMEFLSRYVKKYSYEYEGFYVKPLLKEQLVMDGFGYEKEKKVYDYSYNTVDTIDRARYRREIRKNSGNIYYSIFRTYDPIYVNRVKLIQQKDYIYNNEVINKFTSYNYITAESQILRSITQETTDGINNKTNFFYATDAALLSEPHISELISKNIVGVPLLEQSFKGSRQLFEQKTEYAKNSSTSNLLLPKYIFSRKGDDPSTLFERRITFDLYDEKSNLLQFTPENGIPTSTIWGYNKSNPLAVLQNVAYTAISPTTISSIQNKSNLDIDNCQLVNCKEEELRVELNALRTAFPLGMIITKTYNPLVGETSFIDEKGDKVIYEYDDYNRLKTVRDKNNNILSEKEFHHFTQN